VESDKDFDRNVIAISNFDPIRSDLAWVAEIEALQLGTLPSRPRGPRATGSGGVNSTPRRGRPEINIAKVALAPNPRAFGYLRRGSRPTRHHRVGSLTCIWI
jgi:hypothetical protein